MGCGPSDNQTPAVAGSKTADGEAKAGASAVKGKGKDTSTEAPSTAEVSEVEEGSFKFNLLFLGAGESGKSTILKQIRQVYGEPYSDEELMDMKPHIVKNVIEAMRVLAIYSDLLADEGKATTIARDNEEIRTRVARLTDRDPFTPEVCQDFMALWNDEGIQKTFEYRHKFQLIDTADFLLDRMESYADADYVPTFQDIVHCRRRTIGVHKMVLPFKDDLDRVEQFNIYDVGGQRMERRKWVHFFDHVHAVIYVTALSGYNQSLWEDQSANRMEESMALFRNVIQMESFEKSSVVLFLNKSDLFRKKIKKHKLKEYFPAYSGKENSFSDGVKFIQSLFVDKRPDASKLIYAHVTCATDTENIKRMFTSVRDICIRQNLHEGDFL